MRIRTGIHRHVVLGRVLWSILGAFVLLGASPDGARAAGTAGKNRTARPTIPLISAGNSEYVLVVPDVDPRQRVQRAAELLQKTLAESTGCRLPAVQEAQAPADKPNIYLGKTRAATKAGLPLDKLREWTFCKRVVGKDLFLVGYDASANIQGPLLWPGRPRGLGPGCQARTGTP